MGISDIVVFFGFIAAVLFIGMFKSKGSSSCAGEKGADEYFLAGRGLSWWLIGFSLIAANISAEQFVGMSGQGAGAEGLSCASWEWIAAFGLFIIAFALLPYFLKSGITTIPEFLEIRYNHWARMLMTVSMMGILVVASLIGVTYAGSLVMQQLFEKLGWNLPFWSCCLIMGLMAGGYVLFGGLKACAWADLIQGSALIIGGAVIAYFAIHALSSANPSSLTGVNGATTAASGIWERLCDLNGAKLHMGRPASDTAMPWTILLIGIWIPNFYYWGLNQYITQRILGSGSLAQGQKGMVFAAFLKLLIPFVIVIPGIIAFNLYQKEMADDATSETVQAFIKKVQKISGESSKDPGYKILPLSEEEKESLMKDEALGYKILQPSESWKQKKESIALLPIVEQYNALIKENAVKNKKTVKVDYKADKALGKLITKLIPKGKGILGFVLAALLGAIVSSLAAVLNATSTLFTMDIYKRYIKPGATAGQLVFFGRLVIAVLMVIGVIVASVLKADSIFAYIQKMQLYVSPGIVAVFIFGLVNRRGRRWIGTAALLVSPFLYFIFTTYGWGVLPECIRSVIPQVMGYVPTAEKPLEMHYLWAASYTLITILILMFIAGAFCKLPEPVAFRSNTRLDMRTSRTALYAGVVVVLLTIALYVVFW